MKNKMENVDEVLKDFIECQKTDKTIQEDLSKEDEDLLRNYIIKINEFIEGFRYDLSEDVYCTLSWQNFDYMSPSFESDNQKVCNILSSLHLDINEGLAIKTINNIKAFSMIKEKMEQHNKELKDMIAEMNLFSQRTNVEWEDIFDFID